MTKKLNIVLAATGISSIACDIYLEEISRLLRKKGHRVWLIRVNPTIKTPLHKDDLTVSWTEPKWKIIWLIYLLCPYFFDRNISRAVAERIQAIKEKIDIVNLEIPSLTYCYQRKNDEKIIVRGWYYPHRLWTRLRIMWPVAPNNPLEKLIFMIRQAWYYRGDNYGFKKADAITTLTPKLASCLKNQGATSTWIARGVKVSWIPLGVRLSLAASKEKSRKIKFGCVAYDLENPRKGVRLFLAAIKILEDLNPDSYQIELVGGHTQKLEKEIKNLGLGKRVVLRGRLDHQEVMATLRQWDVFVFPTLFEEFGLVAVEALSAGLVCVGWKIDALEAVWGKAGILLPKGDVNLLAKTMLKLSQNPQAKAKLSRQAWQRAKKYFAWEVVVQKLEKLYLQTIS